MWQTRILLRWFATYGFLTAAGLSLGILAIWDVDVSFIIPVTVTMLQIWFLMLGGLLLFRSRSIFNHQSVSEI